MRYCEDRHGYKRVVVRGSDGVYEIPDEFIINVFSRGVAKSTVIKQIAASMCHCVVLCSNVYYNLLDRGLVYADKDESTLGWFSLYRAGREIMEGYRVGPHESNILHKLISVAIHIAKTTGLRGEKGNHAVHNRSDQQKAIKRSTCRA